MPAPKISTVAQERGKKLRALRESLGLKVWQIAARLEMTTEGYRMKELGRSSLKAEEISELASAMGIPASRLAEALGVIESGSSAPPPSRIGSYRLIPVADARVAAGGHGWVPNGDALTVEDDFARGKDLVGARVSGPCLEPQVPDGAMVLIDRADTRPSDGQIVAVLADGALEIKRYVVNNGDAALVDNQGKSYRFSDVVVLGRVVEVRHRDV